MKKPSLVKFQTYSDPVKGTIAVAEKTKEVPFEVKRSYWIVNTPDGEDRGNHAQLSTEKVIVAISGNVRVSLFDVKGNTFEFELSDPFTGLYIPEMYWKRIVFGDNAVLMCMASTLYNEKDYIRNFEEFKARSLSYIA